VSCNSQHRLERHRERDDDRPMFGFTSHDLPCLHFSNSDGAYFVRSRRAFHLNWSLSSLSSPTCLRQSVPDKAKGFE
jgi:hypothetical protein